MTSEPQPRSIVAEFFDKYATAIIIAVTISVIIGAAGWALEMDRQNTRITVMLQTMTATMARLEGRLADYAGLQDRVVHLEAKHDDDE